MYLDAMKEIGVTPKIAPVQKFALIDGPAFDMADPEKYARSLSSQQPGGLISAASATRGGRVEYG